MPRPSGGGGGGAARRKGPTTGKEGRRKKEGERKKRKKKGKGQFRLFATSIQQVKLFCQTFSKTAPTPPEKPLHLRRQSRSCFWKSRNPAKHALSSVHDAREMAGRGPSLPFRLAAARIDDSPSLCFHAYAQHDSSSKGANR